MILGRRLDSPSTSRVTPLPTSVPRELKGPESFDLSTRPGSSLTVPDPGLPGYRGSLLRLPRKGDRGRVRVSRPEAGGESTSPTQVPCGARTPLSSQAGVRFPSRSEGTDGTTSYTLVSENGVGASLFPPVPPPASLCVSYISY